MSSPGTASPFRPDIEGLRALAVLLVVACHAKVPGLQGGFIGVDVFFVISGYLITRLLTAEWQRSGRIDIAAFYARRVRRLLPAFTFMLAFVLGATWYVYAPTEQPFRLQSAFASALYFSNIHYALLATDYMAPSSKLDPLLHTWSLGVEEQFYLVWPLLLIAAGLLARRTGRQTPLMLILVGLGLVSFVACVLLTQTRQPMAFFLPLTRAWEFCLGAAIVLLEGRIALRAGITAATVAMALLALPVAAMLLSPKSAFPGSAAVAPALGTALLILLVPRLAPGHGMARLLALPPLQWLGRLSYGWYLWHWPLLVIGRVVFPHLGLAGDLALAGVALLLAQLSYALVENPVRESALLARKAVALAGAVAIIGVSLLATSRISAEAIDLAQSDRFQRFYAVRTDVPLIYGHKCDSWIYSAQVTECNAGTANGDRIAVLLGDSHAGQWFSAVNAIAASAGWRLVVMTKSSCPIVDVDYFYDRIGRVFTECAQWRQAAVRRLQALQPDLVIVTSAEDYPLSAAQWAGGTARILEAIAPHVGTIALLRDTPAPGFSAPECLARREWNPWLAPATCSFDSRNPHSDQILAALQAGASAYANVHVIDMTGAICDQNPCDVGRGDTIKYRDTRHLTDSFVRSLAQPLLDNLIAAGTFAR